MKKFILTILTVISAFFISYNYSNAISLASFTPAIDKKVAKMKTTEEKVKWLQSFSELLNSPKFTQDKNAKLFSEIRDYSLNMLSYFEAQLQHEKPNYTPNKTKTSSSNERKTLSKSSTTSLPNLSDNFSNIDTQKVRNTILSWHNEERKYVGVNPYTYNINLEGSATTRANKLAVSSKTSGFHARNNGDGYYNYNSLLNRFSNLGINFPASVNGAASFSETVGYGTYKCSKSDCTDNLITSIKKTWTNLIMKEKSNKGSHYNAATMKHFTQMGAGIAIDKINNRYYLILHYGVDF